MKYNYFLCILDGRNWWEKFWVYLELVIGKLLLWLERIIVSVNDNFFFILREREFYYVIMVGLEFFIYRDLFVF